MLLVRCGMLSAKLPRLFASLPKRASPACRTMATLLPWDQVPEEGVKFAQWPIGKGEIFAHSALTFAFVNLKPIVPGHVLLSPKRPAPRFQDLTPEETADLWQMAQLVAQRIEPHYGCSSATFAMQDGPEAGQTVAHVHIHLLPRKNGQFAKNDEVYDKIEENEAELGKPAHEPLTKGMDADEERKPRTREEMRQEAAELRKLFY